MIDIEAQVVSTSIEGEEEILQAAQHLTSLCHKYHRQLFTLVNAADASGKYTIYWSFLSKRLNPPNRAKNKDGAEELTPEEAQEYFSSINHAVQQISNEQFRVIRAKQ